MPTDRALLLLAQESEQSFRDLFLRATAGFLGIVAVAAVFGFFY